MEEIVSGKKEEPSADDDDPDPAEWVKTSYTYDVTAPYYEVLTETTNGVTTAYDYGVERLSAYSGKSAWNTIKTQYVYDGRGSVVQELSNNNSWYTFGGALSKATKSSYSYTPFGELVSGTNARTTFYAYNGESYDSATGMVNLRARWYEPASMRFSQRDIWHGMIEMPTSQNRYLYCVNDPVGYYDRSGNRVDEDAGKPKKVKTSTSPEEVVPSFGDSIQELRREQLAIQKIKTANRQLEKTLASAGIDINNTDDYTRQIVEEARREIAVKAASGTLTASERERIIQTACTAANSVLTPFERSTMLFAIEYFNIGTDVMTFEAGFIDGLNGYDRNSFGDPETCYSGKVAGDLVRLLGVTYLGATALTEILTGAYSIAGGGGLSLSGVGTIAGAPAIAWGIAEVVVGAGTAVLAVNLGADALADFQNDWDAYQDAVNSSSNSIKKVKNNSEANKLAQDLGYQDAEELKRDFVFKNGAKFNIAYDTKTGEIILISIEDSSIKVFTGLFK